MKVTTVVRDANNRAFLTKHVRLPLANPTPAPPMNYRASYRTILAIVLSLAFCCGLRAAPIHDAAQAGDVARVRALLVADPTLVDAKTDYGFTPLILAAQNGHLEVVKYLLEKSAAVDAKSNDGVTPLIVAAQNGYLEVVKHLLDKGATVDAKSNDGFTPLLFAAQNGHLEVVKLLLDNLPPTNVEAVGYTPLRLAEGKGRMDIAELLRKAGAK